MAVAALRFPLLLLPLMQLAAIAALEQPVRDENGLVEGVTTGEMTAFRGIPYAAAPLGDLRWRVPQPAASCGIRGRAELFPALDLDWRHDTSR
jgi:para-nitrobenzyl esterase